MPKTHERVDVLLYQYAKRLLALRDETESAMAEFKGKMKGSLDLGGSAIPGDFILPAIIGGFTIRLSTLSFPCYFFNGDSLKNKKAKQV